MKIKSSFKDYYDSVVSSGFDQECLYVREEEHFVIPHGKDFVRSAYFSVLKSPFVSIHLGYLGFCGNIYPYIEIDSIFFWTAESLVSFIESKNLKVKKDRQLFNSSLYVRLDEEYSIRYFFENKPKLENIFYDKNIPIFFIELNDKNDRIVLNKNLKEINFMKIKDPYQCYQDLYMFISGVLKSKENETVQISDQDKISKHGFDKWSFRKKGKNSKN